MSDFFKLFSRTFGNYKPHLLTLALLGFLGGLLGGVGINTLVPLLSFVSGQGSSNGDWLTGLVRQLFGHLSLDFHLKNLLIFMVALFVLKGVVTVIFSYINGRVTSDYEERKRNFLFQSVLGANWAYLMQQKLGHLQAVVINDIQQSKSMMVMASSAMLTLANLIVYTLVAVNISWQVTALTFGFGSFIFFVILRPVVGRVRKISAEDERVNKDIAHYVGENILGMKTVKVSGVARQVNSVAGRYFNQMKNLRIRSAIIGALSGSLLEPASFIFIAALLAFSFKTPGFNLVEFAVVIYMSKQIFVYIEQLQSLYVGAAAVIPYTQRVLDYERAALEHKEIDSGSQPFSLQSKLEFQNVSFAYRSDQPVLDNISFQIGRGEMVGLIGPSGAGKTTIVDLILRLFTPTVGPILVDGVNIQDIKLEEWRGKIGYVSQDIFLTNDTIANNIRFYDNSLNSSAIEEAARMANIYDFIQSLPEKFETIVGERGVMLSGGQRQRVIIARVLARRPELLILDEATSALDGESEAKIQATVRNLRGRVTVLVIAHRLSTIQNADRLLVVKDGRITQEGKPADVLPSYERR